MTDWINVENRLPKKNESVLVFERFCDVPFIGFYDCGDKKWEVNSDFIEIMGDAYRDDNIQQEFITHWMPLPNNPTD